jgi:hypothetical protein
MPYSHPQPLPSQQELALLAATLVRNNNPEALEQTNWQRYLRIAMQLHLESRKFIAELQEETPSEEDMLLMFGSDENVTMYANSDAFREKNSILLLRHESGGEGNPALEYVNRRGWKLKTALGLLKAIKSAWGENVGQQIIEKATVMCDSSNRAKIEKYMLDRGMLDRLIKWNKQRRTQRSEKGHESRHKQRGK